MTKKHFQALADTVRLGIFPSVRDMVSFPESKTLEQAIIRELSTFCKAHNPNFDSGRFEQACLGSNVKGKVKTKHTKAPAFPSAGIPSAKKQDVLSGLGDLLLNSHPAGIPSEQESSKVHSYEVQIAPFVGVPVTLYRGTDEDRAKAEFQYASGKVFGSRQTAKLLKDGLLVDSESGIG